MDSEKQGSKEKCLKCLDTGWVFIQDPRDTGIHDLRAQLKIAKRQPCLVCLDEGTVEINDPRESKPERKACPRGCRPKTQN